MPRDKVLIVDDDLQILSSFRRLFADRLDVHTASGVREGLLAVDQKGPYAVVFSDYRMPIMSGVEFLARIKEASPDTVRILLTGYADLRTAVEAVNRSGIFKLLTKPCPSEVMTKSLVEGIRQYRLATAEKELLEKTLRSTVNVWTELLSLVKPDAFGRTSRIESLSRKIAIGLGIDQLWEIEIASALSQIGLFVFPDAMIKRISKGKKLSTDDYQMISEHPNLASRLIAKIPRLEKVAEIVAYQEKNFDGSGFPRDSREGQDIPLGARILKVAIDFDVLIQTGLSKGQALVNMKKLTNLYDPEILKALAVVLGEEAKYAIREVSLIELKENMILAEDVYLKSDARKVLGKGHEITPQVLTYLASYDRTFGVRQPIRVVESLSLI